MGISQNRSGAGRVVAIQDNTSSFTMNGGVLTFEFLEDPAKTAETANAPIALFTSSANATVAINGGTIKSLPANLRLDPSSNGIVTGKTVDTSKATVINWVARIGETYYQTLAAAIETVQSDVTIELLDNVMLGEGSLGIAAKTFTLDLNGKTLNLADKAALNICNWAGVASNAVIKNGIVTGTGDGQKTSNTWNEKIEVWGGSTLEFNRVNITFTNVTCPDTIKNDGGTLKIIDSTVTFDNCNSHGIFVNGTTDVINSTLTHKNNGNMFDGNNPAANKLTITNSTLTATENISGKLLANVDAKAIDSSLTVSTSQIAFHTASVELVKDKNETGSTLTIEHAGSHGFTFKEDLDAIHTLHGKTTMIIIAHRQETIKNCDMVYRVENRKIILERS